MPKPDAELDAKGLVCPEPLMMVRNQIRTMSNGQVLRVEATDPSTRRDLSNFCRFMDHAMLADDQEGDTFVFFIRKGG